MSALPALIAASASSIAFATLLHGIRDRPISTEVAVSLGWPQVPDSWPEPTIDSDNPLLPEISPAVFDSRRLHNFSHEIQAVRRLLGFVVSSLSGRRETRRERSKIAIPCPTHRPDASCGTASSTRWRGDRTDIVTKRNDTVAFLDYVAATDTGHGPRPSITAAAGRVVVLGR